MKRTLRRVVCCAVLVLSLALSIALAQSSQTGTGGAVSSVNALATEAGIEILQAGGNAVDAAVAAAAVINVTDPFSAGIGGGGFMLIYLADGGRVVSLDAREMAPAAAGPDMFLDAATGEAIPFAPERISSGLSVGVPGTLAGWDEALRRYGTMALAEVLAPAIRVAEEGFEIGEVFAQQVESNRERFAVFPATAALFLTPDGDAPAVGSRHENPDLAATFRLIADEGVNAFYRGAVGEDIVATVQSPETIDDPPFEVRPQEMTLADLDAYNVLMRDPTVTRYRGYDVYGMGPPSSGGLTVSLILNILAGYDLATLPEEEALHLMLEASRLAYADRGAYMGDSDFVNVPVAGLLDQDFAATRREAITGEATSDPDPGDPFAFQDDPSPPLSEWLRLETESISTTHLTTADEQGNVVSFTTTIESIGGSGMVVPGRGFLLNNELTDFDATPGGPNTVEPRKRPRSSMAPTIVLQDGEVVFALGSPGGATIITTVLQTLLNLIDFDMPLPEAIGAPRLSQRNTSASSREAEVDAALLGALEARGHAFADPGEIGSVTGVVFNEDGTITAAAEAARRGGGAAQVVDPED